MNWAVKFYTDPGAVDRESDEFKLLNHYLLASSGETHNLKYKVGLELL